jgi:hypothetical protein
MGKRILGGIVLGLFVAALTVFTVDVAVAKHSGGDVPLTAQVWCDNLTASVDAFKGDRQAWSSPISKQQFRNIIKNLRDLKGQACKATH